MRFLTHCKSHHKHPKVHLIVCGGGFQPFKGTNYFWQKEYFAMSFERCLYFALMEEAKGTGHAFCSIPVPEDRFSKEFCTALAPCRSLAPETPSFKVITFEGRDSTARSATNTRAGKRDVMVSESMGRCSAEETQLITPLPPSPLPAACAGAALQEHKLQVRSTALLAGSWQQPPKHCTTLRYCTQGSGTTMHGRWQTPALRPPPKSPALLLVSVNSYTFPCLLSLGIPTQQRQPGIRHGKDVVFHQICKTWSHPMAKISASTTAKALRGQSRAWCQPKRDHICVSKDGGLDQVPCCRIPLQSTKLTSLLCTRERKISHT